MSSISTDTDELYKKISELKENIIRLKQLKLELIEKVKKIEREEKGKDSQSKRVDTAN